VPLEIFIFSDFFEKFRKIAFSSTVKIFIFFNLLRFRAKYDILLSDITFSFENNLSGVLQFTYVKTAANKISEIYGKPAAS
jgi:hypothetical protein